MTPRQRAGECAGHSLATPLSHPHAFNPLPPPPPSFPPQLSQCAELDAEHQGARQPYYCQAAAGQQGGLAQSCALHAAGCCCCPSLCIHHTSSPPMPMHTHTYIATRRSPLSAAEKHQRGLARGTRAACPSWRRLPWMAPMSGRPLQRWPRTSSRPWQPTSSWCCQGQMEGQGLQGPLQLEGLQRGLAPQPPLAAQSRLKRSAVLCNFKVVPVQLGKIK